MLRYGTVRISLIITVGKKYEKHSIFYVVFQVQYYRLGSSQRRQDDAMLALAFVLSMGRDRVFLSRSSKIQYSVVITKY